VYCAEKNRKVGERAQKVDGKALVNSFILTRKAEGEVNALFTIL
jgi:hypothetical protein